MKLPDKAWKACLIVGVVFVLLAVTGGIVKTDLRIENAALIIPVFVLGCVLLLVPAYAGIIEITTDRAVVMQSVEVDLKSIAASFDSPSEGAKLSSPITITGHLKKPLPEGVKLWLMNLGHRNGQVAVWPQKDYKFPKASDKKWSIKYSAAHYSDGDERRLQMFAVGKDGQALIETYHQMNSHFTVKGGRWEGIVARTKDFVAVSPVLTVTLVGPVVSPTAPADAASSGVA